mgnify:CR=1 FL=1
MSTLALLGIGAGSIALLLLLIIRWQVHAFVAMMLVSFLVAHLFYVALFKSGQTWFPHRGALAATLGIGVRSELLANPDSENASESALSRARFLLTTLIEMPKRTLWPRLGSALLGEFAVSYSVTDVTMLRSHELRGTGKLYIALGRPLYLTLSSELYVYRDRDNEAGVALDLNVGLKVVLSGHRQQF